MENCYFRAEGILACSFSPSKEIKGNQLLTPKHPYMRVASINWPLIRHTCGKLLLLEALFLLSACGVSLYYYFQLGERDFVPLLVPTVVCTLLGYGLLERRPLLSLRVTQREGLLIVSGMWIVFSLIGMIPYLLAGTCHSLCDAFLETMSGFTTTGCTVLDNIDAQPHGILYWRSLTQWMGGLGIVVFSLAMLPRIEPGTVQMFSAEVTGVSFEKLHPRIQDTSRTLWFIYIALTLLCAVLYLEGGMSLFDAVNHAMTTLATGGFSTHQASLGWYHSAFIELVCTLFLLIASINFSLYYMVRHWHFSQFWRNEELRWFLYIVLGFTVLFLLFFYVVPSGSVLTPEQTESMPMDFADRLRASLFHVSTIISTCGFQGEYYDYQLWGRIFWLPTLIIMALGGCAGSTAGGFKIQRLVILIKNLKAVIHQQAEPRSFGSVIIDRQVLRHELLQRTLAFLFLFILVSLVCMSVLILQGYDLTTALGTTISAIGNCGPGLGQTGPAFTWSSLPDLSKWVLSFTMLIGRLEIFTFLMLFTRSFWRRW